MGIGKQENGGKPQEIHHFEESLLLLKILFASTQESRLELF